jgi:hypothetical protein
MNYEKPACINCAFWRPYNKKDPNTSGDCDECSNGMTSVTEWSYFCDNFCKKEHIMENKENENYYYFNQNASIIKLIDVMTGALSKYKEELEDKAPVELEELWGPTVSSETGELKSVSKDMILALKKMDERIKYNKNKQDRINKAKSKFCSNFNSTAAQKEAYKNSTVTKVYKRDSKGRFTEVDRY